MQRDWRKSSLGLLVVLAFLLTLGTLFQDFQFDRSLTRERVTLAAIEREIGSLEVALADLRGAQIGYLATGHGPDAWLRRASDLFAQAGATLTRLRESSPSQAARARYDAAVGALANLSIVDKRARDLIQNDQRLLAADVLFADGLELNQSVASELTEARSAEIMTAESQILRSSRLRFALNAFAMGVALMVALYVGRPAKQPPVSKAATMAQMLRELPPAVKPAPPSARVPPPPPVPAASINLPDAAELCVDLARVIDGRDVPALLERAANVLDAKGVIIWMSDAANTTLRPSLTHGYSEKVLRRLGTLEVSADNVTSLAFRSMRPQMMTGATPGAAAAIAVPLMTASGCTGVLAAEIRESRPAPDMVAVTKILAAQFATLIGPGDLTAKAAEA